MQVCRQSYRSQWSIQLRLLLNDNLVMQCAVFLDLSESVSRYKSKLKLEVWSRPGERAVRETGCVTEITFEIIL